MRQSRIAAVQHDICGSGRDATGKSLTELSSLDLINALHLRFAENILLIEPSPAGVPRASSPLAMTTILRSVTQFIFARSRIWQDQPCPGSGAVPEQHLPRQVIASLGARRDGFCNIIAHRIDPTAK
jgi:hypothetical protein